MIDIVTFVEKSVFARVIAIRDGLGKMPPKRVLDEYRRLWQVDPIEANIRLVFFEFMWNEIPFPEGSDEEAGDKMTVLTALRLGSDEALQDWAIGIYGYPSPPEQGLVN